MSEPADSGYTKLDRLMRSMLHLAEIAEGLKQKDVELVVLDQNIDINRKITVQPIRICF